LVYPEFPASYWGYNFALDFVGKKSAMPPLGLLTVAGLFPEEYPLKVVDMNVHPLTDEHLEWADLVFTSTMIVQQDSLKEVVSRCNQARIPVIAGGPHPTSYYEDLEGVDHLVLDEVEDTLPDFLHDLEQGTAQRIYRSPEKPEVSRSPLPRYDLIDLNAYATMALQFSRGCPFDCEFCDITKLFGRKPRTKTNEQMLAEFDLLYRLGWRGSLFLVDDNFIGNKRAALSLLTDVAQWQKERDYPFSLFTEASVNLGRLEPLMDAMIDSGFSSVFLGIETPNPEALLKTKKKQNTRTGEEHYLINAVRTIQQKGMEVMGGFILGLDGDNEDAFDSQIEFIQEAGIPMAMVGLLSALKGTDLYHRLQREGRLLKESTGNNFSITLNFETEMDRDVLIEGYKRVLTTIYDPTLKNYFERCWTLLKNLKFTEHTVREVGKAEMIAVAKSLKRQLFSRQGPAYLRFLVRVFRHNPGLLPEAVRLGIMGYHFEKITSQQIAVHAFEEYLDAELAAFREALSRFTKAQSAGLEEVRSYAQDLYARVQQRHQQIHRDFRDSVQDTLDAFQQAVDLYVEQLSGPLTS
jgi:radical SAM superfamily enzyme YgiQ (UPF0313 family)